MLHHLLQHKYHWSYQSNQSITKTASLCIQNIPVYPEYLKKYCCITKETGRCCQKVRSRTSRNREVLIRISLVKRNITTVCCLKAISAKPTDRINLTLKPETNKSYPNFFTFNANFKNFKSIQVQTKSRRVADMAPITMIVMTIIYC